MNSDTHRDALDIGAFVSCLLGDGSDCACADLDKSGAIGAADLSAFVDALLTIESEHCPT